MTTVEDVPFTPAEIDAAEKLKACTSAIEWLRAAPRTLTQLAEHNEDWARWIVEYAPSHAERAWAALLSRPGGVSEDGLRWILEYIPAYSERAAAELRRRKRTKPLNRKAREKK